ncbi:MFS transporter [Arachnia propionica]|uniref:MFS transporter n=1 Tax=Arachnia propionica TaxID=1750 RepID=A0A3P1WS66_9ACTN|nr:MFS transporter [Arachnia propionica]RRD49135.1 MFS transporter [Arachnia propionica]
MSLTHTQRLDRLPWTRRHSRMLLGSGVGWALDAMDIGLIAFVVAALAKEWSLGDAELSLLASAGFLGMALGASLGGLLADRIGRRQVFALTLLVYGLATGASALAGSVAALIVLRFVVGLGLGAELPVASTLVSEYAPRRIRGRVVVILESFWAVGWLLAAVLGYFLVPAVADGWRWALALGALPALYSLVVRFGLPESVRFLVATGRTDEAERIVADLEREAGIGTPATTATPEPAPRVPWRTLFDVRFRARTIGLWLTWFGINFAYYGAFIWLPTLLTKQGMSMVQSFGFVLWMTLAQFPGYVAAAILVEVWGRRPTLVSFLGGSAVGALLFGFAPQIATATGWSAGAVALAAGCVLSFFNLGAWGALYAMTPEVYPTAMRASGSGAATAFGRLAALLAPLLVLRLREDLGMVGLFVVFGAMFALAMGASLLLPEYQNRELAER